MAGKVYFNNKQQVATAFYNGTLISKGYSNEVVTFDGNLVTLTINSTPSDAIITFSNYGIGEISSDGKSIRIKKGSNITYNVSFGSVSQTNTITNLINNQIINVILVRNAGLISESVIQIKDADSISGIVNQIKDAGWI